MMPLALSGRYDATLERKRITVTAPYKVRERSTVNRGPLYRPYTIDTESERAFPYEVEQYDARYHLDATLNLQLLEAGAPLVVRVDWKEKRKAYQHDVTFPPAGVHPRRANLPTVNTWLSARLARKQVALVKKLEGRWTKAFCAGPRFGPEDGARCVYGGGERVNAAVSAVATVFGKDTQAMLEQMVRGRAPPAPDEAKPKDKPGEETPEPAEPEVEDVKTGSADQSSGPRAARYSVADSSQCGFRRRAVERLGDLVPLPRPFAAAGAVRASSTLRSAAGHRLQSVRRVDRLREIAQRVAAGDHDRRRQAHRVVQAVHRRHRRRRAARCAGTGPSRAASCRARRSALRRRPGSTRRSKLS